MTNFYSGIAGSRGCAPSGLVIHNDAGSQAATASFYRNWLPTHNAENGFAHYYVASDGVYQAEAESNMAWHTANATGNAYYIGIEACQSTGDEATFRGNEQACFKLAADILKRYGLPADANTVMLHREFVSTSCPHRSWELHGKSVDAVKGYFIQEIKKYMGETSNTNSNNATPNKPTKGSEITMQCLYEKGNDLKYFDGVSTRRLTHPDEAEVLKDIYRQNNGKEMPYYGKDKWNEKARWYDRLETIYPSVK